mmetsp:Transcript_3832/g.8781  ORF Transcript_3832/g.8781 Transcript_3832/m.8781 type:complete len:232 (-) Transcript_3832:333-1028(-)
MEALSAGALKRWLVGRGVDVSGCLEKGDLIERAKQSGVTLEEDDLPTATAKNPKVQEGHVDSQVPKEEIMAVNPALLIFGNGRDIEPLIPPEALLQSKGSVGHFCSADPRENTATFLERTEEMKTVEAVATASQVMFLDALNRLDPPLKKFPTAMLVASPVSVDGRQRLAIVLLSDDGDFAFETRPGAEKVPTALDRKAMSVEVVWRGGTIVDWQGKTEHDEGSFRPRDLF